MAEISSINPGAAALQSLLQSSGNRTERNQQETSQRTDSISLEPAGGQRILAGQIQQVLTERLSIQAPAALDSSNGDFSPQAVSNRILGFVENALRSAPDNETANTLLQQAREGIERGLNEARDILTGLNALNGAVEEGVNQTEDLLQAGLQALQQQLDQGGLQPPANDNAAAPVQVTETRLQANEENTISFEVRTREGDTVRVEIQRRQGVTVNTVEQALGDDFQSQININRFVLSDFEVGIQGELNPDEAVAVQDLVSSVQNLADSFFNNNLDQVLASVPGLQFDSEQLSAFSLNLTQSVSVQQAYSVGEGSSAQLRDGLQQAGNFLGELRQTEQQAAEDLPFDEPRQFVDDLLASFIRLDDRFQSAPTARQQNIDSLVEQLYS